MSDHDNKGFSEADVEAVAAARYLVETWNPNTLGHDGKVLHRRLADLLAYTGRLTEELAEAKASTAQAVADRQAQVNIKRRLSAKYGESVRANAALTEERRVLREALVENAALLGTVIDSGAVTHGAALTRLKRTRLQMGVAADAALGDGGAGADS